METEGDRHGESRDIGRRKRHAVIGWPEASARGRFLDPGRISAGLAPVPGCVRRPGAMCMHWYAWHSRQLWRIAPTSANIRRSPLPRRRNAPGRCSHGLRSRGLGSNAARRPLPSAARLDQLPSTASARAWPTASPSGRCMREDTQRIGGSPPRTGLPCGPHGSPMAVPMVSGCSCVCGRLLVTRHACAGVRPISGGQQR